MSIRTAHVLVQLLIGYLAVGLVFAAVFVTRLVGRLDPAAQLGTLGFRLLIVPGVAALWPYLAARLLAGATAPPDGWSAHRAAAGSTRVATGGSIGGQG